MPFPLESLEQMQLFFWVLVRVSFIFFLLPLFGARGVPLLWKAGVSMLLAIVLTPVVPSPKTFPDTVPEVLLGVMSEAILAFLLTFGIKMLFTAVQIAGQFMSFQMGFTMARAIDPTTGMQSTSLSQFLYLFTVLVFFSIDGHHLFIRALANSFQMVPPTSFSLKPTLASVLVKTSSLMLLLALKIAAPIMITLFLSNLCLGIVARTVPQVNILMIGFPVNICLGLIVFSLVLGNFSPFLIDLTRMMDEVLKKMIQMM